MTQAEAIRVLREALLIAKPYVPEGQGVHPNPEYGFIDQALAATEQIEDEGMTLPELPQPWVLTSLTDLYWMGGVREATIIKFGAPETVKMGRGSTPRAAVLAAIEKIGE